MMDIVSLIHHYGYVSVAVGTFLEGETVLVAAGAAASQHYLWLPWVIVTAAVSGFLGDQLFFYLGHVYGNRILCRFPRLKPRTDRVKALLMRHHVSLILFVRFMYGLRIIGPFAIGTSGVPRTRFLALNLLGSAIWASIIAMVGYGTGKGFNQMTHTLGALPTSALLVVIAAVLLVFAIPRIIIYGKHVLNATHR